MRKFDLVTFLLTLAGRIQERRHAKLVAREDALRATIEAARAAIDKNIVERVDAQIRHQDIKRVK